MYDTIFCKKELPLTDELKSLNIKWNDISYQTKSLENCLLEYTITKDGKLTETVIEREYVYWTDEEKKTIKPKPWQIFKEVKETSTKEVVLDDFHGKLDFYAFESLSEEEDIWVDFTAFFSYGNLDKIVLVEVKRDKTRIINNQKWFKEREILEQSFIYRLKKATGWFAFWRMMSKLCSQTSHFLSKINALIIRDLL